MNYYYYNNNTDNKGNHEVHTDNCTHLPTANNRRAIGYAANCQSAINSVKQTTGKTNFDGCYYCCNACHTG